MKYERHGITIDNGNTILTIEKTLVGVYVEATFNVDFIDGTQHREGVPQLITEENIEYFKKNCNLYEVSAGSDGMS